MTIHQSRFFCTWILTALLSFSMICKAEMPVEPKLQAMLIKKVVGFDKLLGKKEKITIGIVYSVQSRQVANILVTEFGSNGIQAEAISLEELADKLTTLDVVYLAPGTDAAVATIAGSGKLRISGVPEYANQGLVSVAVTKVKGKPKILVHKGCLTADSHEFSGKLMKLATIVG